MTVSEEARGRRRMVTERDARVLRWVGEQYLAPRDVLAELLGRASDDEATRAAGMVTDTVVDRTLRRWRDLRLAESCRLALREAPTIWPTRAGMQIAGLGYRALEPSLVTLVHRHAVARVRARAEATNPTGTWICERELRDAARGRRIHIPDGVVEFPDGTRFAIEVELTSKTEERVREILRGLFVNYQGVVYYATPGPAGVVRKAGKARLDSGELLLRTYPLPERRPAAPPAAAKPTPPTETQAPRQPIARWPAPVRCDAVQATLDMTLPQPRPVAASSPAPATADSPGTSEEEEEVPEPVERRSRWATPVANVCRTLTGRG